VSDQFSASASALGYLYQVRYSLYLLLRGVREDPNCAISVERLDDVAFEENGQAIELIQLKHTIYAQQADLTDASERLWKTLRIWSLKLKEEPEKFRHILLSLVTTGVTGEGSAARRLREGKERQETEALAALRQSATSSSSKSNKAAYEAFMSLSLEQQQLLLSRIRIVDSHSNIIEVKDKIAAEFRVYTPYYEALYSRLEGWWFDKIVEHLVSTDQIDIVSGEDLTYKIWELSDQLKTDNLPNDFPEVIEMDESELSTKERVFVEQLKLILIGSRGCLKKALPADSVGLCAMQGKDTPPT
jgi:hypothetical protein